LSADIESASAFADATGVEGMQADVATSLGRIVAEHGVPSIVIGFPPCTDLAISGARWWKAKAEARPDFQRDAIALARSVDRFASLFGAPWMIENPVGKLSTGWRRPNTYANPSDFGGWIDEGEAAHPLYPQHIERRDAYTKKTGLWFGGGFVEPEKRPVEPERSAQHRSTGGWKGAKMIRSITPRGLARAIFAANRHFLQ
jgi:hypothetical protein